MAAIVTRHPRRAMTVAEHPVSLFDELARELWSQWPFVSYERTVSFKLDMYEEKDDELVVKAELPGIKKEDVDISITGDMLTIKAEKKSDQVSENTTYFTCERPFGQIIRTVTLPFAVDADKAVSTFEDGVLEIHLPKSEESKSRHIMIKSR